MPRQTQNTIIRLFIGLAIGVTSGLLCKTTVMYTAGQAGDFGWAYRAAIDLQSGHDVYQRPFGEDLVSYPLPAAFIAFPLTIFSPANAASIFFGASSALLAWCLSANQQYWRLLIFMSWPYWYSLIFVQWTPLLTCMAFLSSLLPLLLVKPQSAIPLLVFHPFTRWGVALLSIVGVASLFVYPTWILVWIKQISGYRGVVPPIFSLPLGPLLLFALFRIRDRRTWFFLLSATMPQRVVYDQLALSLVAGNQRELLFTTACSWITLLAVLFFGSWGQLPGGWQNWIVATLYMPALLVLLRRNIENNLRTETLL